MRIKTSERKRERGSGATLLLGALIVSLMPGLVVAEEPDEDETGWSNVAELSYVATGGNAEAETLSLRNTLERSWEGATLTIETGALRAEDTTTTRVAVGDPDSFRVDEDSTTRLTAESYFLRGRYERRLSERFFWLAGAGWERNEFAGIANRLQAMGGVGHVWREDDAGHFKTAYGVTFTDQEDVVGGSTSFAGVRLRSDLSRALTATTTFSNLAVVDVNADETSDVRLDMLNSLAVAINDRLALKLGLQLLYDAEPSLTAIPLLSAGAQEALGTVLVPLDELDTVFNVALVVNF